MGTDRSLDQRLKRLMLFRVVMITTLLLIAIYVEAVSETLLPVNPLYLLIVATYVLTLLYVLGLRYAAWHQAQAYLQVVLDLVLVTGLVYLTGGPGSRAGFMLLYPIAILSGSILLYRRNGVMLAGVATVLYAGMLWAVREGWVQSRGLADVPSLPATHVLYSVFVTGVACVTVALIGAYLSESLKTVGTQLEVASEQVADLQELHQVVVRSMHSGLMTADLAGRLLFINEFGQSILGRPAESLRGQPIGDIMGTRLLEAPALRARAAHEDLDRMEFPYRRPDGLELELGISVSPLATADPAFGAYLLVFQNLTRLKRLEQEIRTKEKLAAVGEMAAQLAHEIRNPLGSISGSAQVLMEEKTLSIEQNHLLAIIVRESKRLSGTLNQFLYQVRPSASPRGPVDLGRVLSEAVTLLENGAEVRPNHEVVFEMDEGPHVCLGDPDQILQVFWNLTRNALEAMPLGGTLRIEVRRRGDTLVLLCRDHGRGISREEQRRIFEPFQSGSPVGTGLGLAIVYQIVREHGGDIAVKSTPGQGTDVEVRLPLLNTPVPA